MVLISVCVFRLVLFFVFCLCYSPFESRFPINVGITGFVATTGEVCPTVLLNLVVLKDELGCLLIDLII